MTDSQKLILLADSQSLIADSLVHMALTKLGAPYVWATAGPDTFDCSGFTWWIACQVLGPQDPELRSSHHQFNVWGRGPQVTGDYEGEKGGSLRLGGTLRLGGRGQHETGPLLHPSPLSPFPPLAGDLVFFDTMGVVVMGNRASHVGLMIDEDRFIHAANEKLGVRIDPLRGGWYEPRYIGAGHFVAGGGGVAGSQGK